MSAWVFPRDNEKMLVPAPRTLLERKLDAFTAAIREKPEWWEKVNRSDVVERWRSEAAQQDVDDEMFNFAMQQLRHQAGQCDKLGVRPSPVPGVFESEQLLDTELQQELLAALRPLEDVPDEDSCLPRDWHPGSNKQVLDIVHPSLFPLVYGLSPTTTSARPPPPRNGQITASVSTPPLSVVDGMNMDGDDAADDWDADGAEVLGEGVGLGAADVTDDEDPDLDADPQDEAPDPEEDEENLSDLEAGDEDAGPEDGDLDGDDEDFPELREEEEDGYRGVLHERMAAPSAQSKEARAAAAAAAAAAPLWHTAAFNQWKTAMGTGTPITEPPAKSSFVSAKFQWLPADVLVGADGRVVFDSYVNNMHPERHGALYAATARLLEVALPLFERTLAASTRVPKRVAQFNEDCEAWWKPDYFEWWESIKDSDEMPQLLNTWRRQQLERDGLPADDAAVAQAAAEEEGEDIEEMYCEETNALYKERREFQPPTLPATYEPPPPPPPLDLRRRRLQVIVKYAEIVLTPEQPRYGGGVWHVEGMENEAIVASCIAYLAADDISESRLHFRSMVSDPSYAQDDHEGVQRMYGILDESRLNDPLGSVLCAPGRMLCWPNALQHRVAPFELADASRPGVRKIAVLFLVDPRFRVLSTRDVPPQQLAWHDSESRLGSVLPVDVKRKVDALREFPISLERAKALRLELMEERKIVIRDNNHEAFERKFSLCEH